MNEKELQEYTDYLRSQGFSDAEAREFMVENGMQVGPTSTGGKALDYGLRALDYTSNLGRGAAFGAYQAATGENLGVNFEDVIKGKTPESAELMRRAGVQEGGVLDDGTKVSPLGSFTPSGRGVEGFALDVALDPLTYLTLGAVPALNALGKASKGSWAEKLVRPASKGVETGGTNMWKSAFKRLDAVNERFGKKPVSDLLVEKNVVGSERDIVNQMNKIQSGLKGERDAIIDAATKSGAEANVDQMLKPAEDYVAQLKAANDPSQVGMIRGMENQIAMYRSKAAKEAGLVPQEPLKAYAAAEQKAVNELAPNSYLFQPNAERQIWTDIKGNFPENQADSIINNAADEIISLPVPMKMGEKVPGPSPTQMNAWKENLYETIAQSNWDKAKSNPTRVDFKKALARGAKEATETAVGDAAPQLIKTNDELGRFLTTRQRALRDAEIAENKNAVTSIDALLAWLNPKAAAAKKLGDISKGSSFRTKAGKAIKEAGENAPESFWRQILLTPTDRDK